jgi:hypothetical protein
MGQTAYQNYTLPLFKLLVYRVAIRLQIAFIVFEQFCGTFPAPSGLIVEKHEFLFR